MWEKSCKEQELDILQDWHDEEFFDAKFGKGRWRAMKRFAVWQPNANDWRVIDNGLSSDHNDVVQAYEKIHTASSSLGFAIARYLYRLICFMGSLCRLKRGTRDWKRAYRQLPRWMQHAAYHIVCAWAPRQSEVAVR